MKKQESDKLNEIVEKPYGAELLSESPKPSKKKAKKKAAKTAPVDEDADSTVSGIPAGARFKDHAGNRYLFTKENKLAKFADRRNAIIALKRFGGRILEEGSDILLKYK